jgi:hypothetical protein
VSGCGQTDENGFGAHDVAAYSDRQRSAETRPIGKEPSVVILHRKTGTKLIPRAMHFLLHRREQRGFPPIGTRCGEAFGVTSKVSFLNSQHRLCLALLSKSQRQVD